MGSRTAKGYRVNYIYMSIYQCIHLLSCIYLSYPQGLAKINWNLQRTRLCTLSLCVCGVNGK